MRRLPSATLIVVLLVALTAARQTPPPGDCDIRRWRDAFTNDAYAALTLILRGPTGPIPINMSLIVVRRAKARAGADPEVSMEFLTSAFAGRFDFTAPHVVLVLDRDLDSEIIEAAAVEPTADMFAVSRLIIRYDAARLRRLAKATTIDGRVLGVDFVLTTRQLRAIRDFVRSDAR
jgi:hypothetical protein